MKNKKAIIIIAVVTLAIVAVLAISMFVGRKISTKKEINADAKEMQPNNLEIPKENKGSLDENKESVEYTKIVTNSKIGVELQDLIKISNLYSDSYYKELDANMQITDDAKRIFTYSRIVTSEDYSKYIRYSENYIGSYITKKDFDKVSKELFGNDTNLAGKDIVSQGDYDTESSNYIVSPMGLCGNDVKITLDVPYKMLEYDDRIEMYVYRLYVTQNASSNQENAESTVDNVYSDYDRQKLVISFKDDTLQDEATQTYNMLEKIEEKNIDTTSFKKGMYIIKGIGSSRYIDSYKEM